MSVAEQLKKWAKAREDKPFPKKAIASKPPMDDEEEMDTDVEEDSIDEDEDEDKDEDKDAKPGSPTPMKDNDPLMAYKKKIVEQKGKVPPFAKVKKG